MSLAMKDGYINNLLWQLEHIQFFGVEKGITPITSMKSFVAVLFALAAVASASVVVPQTYSYRLASPLAYSAPLAYSSPLAYSAPFAYSAPIVAAPAIRSGYVAATPGAVHTAPLPEGPLAFSHHLNTAPAPGTF